MTSPSPRRRRLFRVLRILASFLVLGLLFELALRSVLFLDTPLAERASGMRTAGLYAPRGSEEYWKLDHVFSDPERRREARHHPRLGWTHQRFDGESLAHVDGSRLRGRRPVLIFGDSFAACVTPRAECWGGLLARSEYGETHCLLNYGVPGYGFDQTWLLMSAALETWAERDPIVVLSVLVDADLERSMVPFKGWPKPRLAAPDRLELVEEPVIDGADAYLAAHPVGIVSYAWRWLVHGSGMLPAGWTAALGGVSEFEEETRALNAAILAAAQAELEARGLDYFVLVFHGLRHLDPEFEDWRDGWLTDELERLEMPYVRSKVELVGDHEATGRPVETYFYREGMERRHYTAEGNRVVFGALARGLRGEFE